MSAYHVYVVLLDDAAARRAESKRRIRAGGQAYYVGSSGLPLRERLRQQAKGKRGGGHVVHRYGRRVVKTLRFPTRAAAESAESRIAHALARSGHVVYFG